MGAKSGKQYRFMQSIAHGSSNKGVNTGPSEAVAKEFIHKTPAKKRKMWAHKNA